MKKQLSITFLSIFLAFIFGITSCKKGEDEVTPVPDTNITGGATLTTVEATAVTNASAILGANITSIGDCALTEHGIVLSTSASPTTGNSKYTDTTITGTGSFSVLAGSLLPATTYYARAFATNCKGTNYGNEIHFTTLGGGASGTPTVSTTAATNITNTSAITGGSIISIGTCLITEHGIALSTTPNPTTSHTTYTDNTISGVGNFSIPLGGLSANTTYHVRAYATNCNGTAYGNDVQFTTTNAGGTADTGYFKLTVDGVVYFSYDFLSPAGATVFPEGDTRDATIGTTLGFVIHVVSSRLGDVSSPFGFFFDYQNLEVNGIGTYQFTKGDSSKQAHMILRTGTGAYDPITNPSYNLYDSGINYARHFQDSCHRAESSYAVNTLTITHWGDPFVDFIEGTITGTIYEDAKAQQNCANSMPKSYTVEFKLLRTI